MLETMEELETVTVSSMRKAFKSSYGHNADFRELVNRELVTAAISEELARRNSTKAAAVTGPSITSMQSNRGQKKPLFREEAARSYSQVVAAPSLSQSTNR